MTDRAKLIEELNDIDPVNEPLAAAATAMSAAAQIEADGREIEAAKHDIERQFVAVTGLEAENERLRSALAGLVDAVRQDAENLIIVRMQDADAILSATPQPAATESPGCPTPGACSCVPAGDVVSGRLDPFAPFDGGNRDFPTESEARAAVARAVRDAIGAKT